MKVSSFTLNLSPKDVLLLIKKFIDPEDKLKTIAINEEGIYLFLPTFLSFELKIRLKINCFSGRHLRVEIQVTNLNFIPEGIKEKAIEKFIPEIEVKGIKQAKNELLIDISEILQAAKVEMEIESIESSKEGIKITGKNLSVPLPF
jgi:hypothetical protein